MSYLPHQIEASTALQASKAYLIAGCRTGKTRCIIHALKDVKGRVLVLTKKAAIGGWESELAACEVTGWTITNYERLRSKNWDSSIEWSALVGDELHSVGKYPKPCLVAPIMARLRVTGPRFGLTATPCAESYSQLFHQVKALRLPLWAEFKNFYAWHKKYGVPDLIRANGRMLETYKKVSLLAWEEFQGFCHVINRQEVMSDFVESEDVVCPIEAPEVLELCSQLKEDMVLSIKGHDIIADTPLALAQKSQQMCSGAVLDDAGEAVEVWGGKVDWLGRFSGAKIAVLTGFRAEVGMIGRRWASEGITDDPETFTDEGFTGWFVGSWQRFARGVNLSSASAVVITSCPWSSEGLIQARDRLLRRDRVASAPVYFPVVAGGVDEAVYRIVAGSKRDFTAKQYERAGHPKGDN